MRKFDLEDLIRRSRGMVLDGVAASEAIDSSGEILDVDGCDISDWLDGKGVLNYEHRGDDANGASGNDVVGKIVYAKKVQKESDCDDDRQRQYWKDLRETPYIYVVNRLYDGSGHEGAKALAAQIRDHVVHDEPILVRYSIEGSTLKRDSNRLKKSVAKRLAMTIKPCNRTCASGMLADPAWDGGEVKKAEGQISTVGYVYGGEFTMLPKAKPGADFKKAVAKVVRRRVGNDPKAVRAFLKANLPAISNAYMTHFREATDDVTAPKSSLGKAEQTSLFGAEDKPAPPTTSPMTVRGTPVSVPNVKTPEFDERSGMLHTPKGSFKVYIPSEDTPENRASFHNLMHDPKINAFHGYAVRNWAKMNGLLKRGKLPPEAIMHATLFSQLSPNTPVPMQELMYSVSEDTILETAEGVSKRIDEFVPADRVRGIDRSGRVVDVDVVALHDHGQLEGYEVEFDDGYRIDCSANHKFLTVWGQLPIKSIVQLDLEVVCVEKEKRERLAEPMRQGMGDGSREEGTSQGLYRVQGDAKEDKERHSQGDAGESRVRKTVPECFEGSEGTLPAGHERYREMASREPAAVCGESAPSIDSDARLAEGTSEGDRGARERADETLASRASPGVHGECLPPRATGSEMASGASCGSGRDHAQASRGTAQVLGISNRGDTGEREVRCAVASGDTDRLRSGEEEGGLCITRQTSLDGGGRVLAFLSGRQPEEPLVSSETGRDVESGGSSSRERNTGAPLDGVLFFKDLLTEGAVAGADREALGRSLPRGVVLRKVVRYVPVGVRRMYDLEVAHRDHNFLLPNGVVTSNSHLVDMMREKGIDPRSPEFAAHKEAWTSRDQPQGLPQHTRQHFENMGDAIRIGRETGQQGLFGGGDQFTGSASSDRGRRPGEMQSFMLANNKWDNMAKYHTLHDSLVELVHRHRDDGRSAVQELMAHKQAADQWEARRNKAVGNGGADPGPYTAGPAVPGLAPKTARYTYGMLGGGNTMVPDTHFTRYLFGLEKGRDDPAIHYLKDVLWNPNNTHVLNGLDRYYADRHDAVQHMMEHPEHGRLFDSKEHAIFPAFWKNWVAIAPHEAARGMKTGAFNETTDHRPFWEAIDPFLPKRVRKSEEMDYELPMQTAQAHHQLLRDYGMVPSQMLYYRYLAPRLTAKASLE